MARLSCRAGNWAGWNRDKAAPTVGQDAGCLESRGWRRGFTLRLYFHPRPPQPSPPASPALIPRTRVIRSRNGAGERRAGHAVPIVYCARP
jgi:hypothetical protein